VEGDMTLWRFQVQMRDGQIRTIELRALSEAMAIEKVSAYRPDLTILSVARRPTALTPSAA
jgi:hypothetical protein